MFEWFGWFEFSILCIIAGAFYHGLYLGRREGLVLGVELTLKNLEEEGVIVVSEEGEVTAVK